MTVKVITDSASDITQEQAARLGIIVVPVYLRFGEKVYRDGIDIDTEEFYKKLETDPVHPSTASPSPGDFAKVFDETAKDSDEIVSIHVTSKHSSVYSSALLGKENMKKKGCHIEVIDSQGVTMWQGLVAIAAVKAAETGDSIHQVVEKIHETIHQLRALALLDTIKYIVKGGRLGKASSLVSNIESILQVKTLLTLRDGELHPSGLIRSHAKGIERLQKFIKSASHVEEMAIVHSTEASKAQALADYACSLFPGLVTHIVRLGPVVGVHGGPGTLMTVLRETVRP